MNGTKGNKMTNKPDNDAVNADKNVSLGVTKDLQSFEVWADIEGDAPEADAEGAVTLTDVAQKPDTLVKSFLNALVEALGGTEGHPTARVLHGWDEGSHVFAVNLQFDSPLNIISVLSNQETVGNVVMASLNGFLGDMILHMPDNGEEVADVTWEYEK